MSLNKYSFIGGSRNEVISGVSYMIVSRTQFGKTWTAQENIMPEGGFSNRTEWLDYQQEMYKHLIKQIYIGEKEVR